MRKFLALFLCAAVLLSGCMTANVAIFKPKRGGAGEAAALFVGVLGDLIPASAAAAIIESDEPLPAFIVAFLLIFGIDILYYFVISKQE
jgi:hypothetical protein